MSPKHMICESMKYNQSVNSDRYINSDSRNILIIVLLFLIIEAIYSITSPT